MSRASYERLQKNVAKLRERQKDIQADRVKRGLPADPPPPFVPLAVGYAIYKRCEPLINYGVTYAKLCDSSDEIIEIPPDQMAWIKSHEYDIILLRNINGGMGLLPYAIENIYTKLVNANQFETVGELVRELTRNITRTRTKYGEYQLGTLAYDSRLSIEENEQIGKEVAAEYKRLSDEDYYRQEYDRLVEHYETIKHLY